MNTQFIRIINILATGLLLITLNISTGWAGRIYKWSDDEGNTVYSQNPPPEGIMAEIVRGAPPPPVDPKAAMDTLRKRSQAFGERRGDRVESEANEKDADDKAKKLSKTCEQLKKNLQDMQQYPQVQVKDDKGKIRTLGEEEKQKRIKSTKERIQKECSGSK